jgi:alkaline phosphatase D
MQSKFTSYRFLAATLIFSLCWASMSFAQDQYVVEMGPMAGHFTDTTEIHWFLLRKTPDSPSGTAATLEQHVEIFKKRMEVKSVDIKQEKLLGDREVAWVHLTRTAPTLPKDTINFLTGSCAFQYPFPLNAGGKRRRLNQIFSSMAKEEADFMVWTGDNVYYLAGEWNSYKGMVNKMLKVRTRYPIDGFLKSCPQYAIWDDHDYGPNDSDGKFELKDTSLAVFKKFWANPYYGTETQNGVFTHFSQGDCDFLLLDSRYDCDKSTEVRKLLGDKQMEWLKQTLLASKANFKFVFSGTQFLPVEQSGETWGKFPKEHGDFMKFLADNNITGVILVSGDRHYSELNKEERPGTYPLYEFTCSPLTSFMDPSYPKNNPLRVEGTAIRTQNYGRVKVFNDGAERVCRLEEFDRKGKLIWKYDLKLSELK